MYSTNNVNLLTVVVRVQILSEIDSYLLLTLLEHSGCRRSNRIESLCLLVVESKSFFHPVKALWDPNMICLRLTVLYLGNIHDGLLHLAFIPLISNPWSNRLYDTSQPFILYWSKSLLTSYLNLEIDEWCRSCHPTFYSWQTMLSLIPNRPAK